MKKGYPGDKAGPYKKCVGEEIDGYCRGLPQGAGCDYSYKCDIGLTCSSNNVCIPGGEEGQYCERDRNECKSYLFCFNNVCTRYGSLANGQSTTSFNNYICQSNYLSNKVCSPGPKLQGPIFVHAGELPCYYSPNWYMESACGYHKDGKAVCYPGAGDFEAEWKILLNYLSKKPACRAYGIEFGLCDYGEVQHGREYLRAAIAHWRMVTFVDIQGLPECLKVHVNAEYFDLLKRYSGATSLSAIIGLLIAVLLFI